MNAPTHLLTEKKVPVHANVIYQELLEGIEDPPAARRYQAALAAWQIALGTFVLDRFRDYLESHLGDDVKADKPVVDIVFSSLQNARKSVDDAVASIEQASLQSLASAWEERIEDMDSVLRSAIRYRERHPVASGEEALEERPDIQAIDRRDPQAGSIFPFPRQED